MVKLSIAPQCGPPDVLSADLEVSDSVGQSASWPPRVTSRRVSIEHVVLLPAFISLRMSST